jgi:hypothetical protein
MVLAAAVPGTVVLTGANTASSLNGKVVSY